MASDDNFWGVYANAPVFGQAHRKLGFFFSMHRCKENLVFVGGRLVNAQSPLEFAKKSFRKVEKYTCKTLLNKAPARKKVPDPHYGRTDCNKSNTQSND